MLKKFTIILTALSVLLTSVGPLLPQTAYASANNDALVKTILKAAASAAAGKLAELVAKELATAAKTNAQDVSTAKPQGALAVPTHDDGLQAITTNVHTTDESIKNQSLLEWVESFAKTVIQKAVLDVVVDQIITYIQGGGKPQFVTDWQGFVEGAGQRAAGDFAKSLGAGFLCEPFSLQLQLAIGGKPKKFSEEATCTLDKIVSNIQDFADDFRTGGWVAYGESWKIQNNFLGSLVNAQEKSGRVKEAAGLAALNEAVAGKGFTSPKKCVKDAQGQNLDNQAAALEKAAAGAVGTPQYPSLKAQADGARASANAYQGKPTCKIITPGSTLGDLTTKALGSNVDFLLNADQLGDYVSAIVDAVLNRVIDEGLDKATSH